MSTSFVLCVESGHFEAQTLLAIACLREFGGRFASAPVLAVTPRFGHPLARTTLERFESLGVEYVREDRRHRYAWYPYTNKALAAEIADERARTEQVIWLDSDVLVVSEPGELVLASDEDVAICSVDKNVGSSGPEDPHEAYWVAMANAFSMRVDDLPWVVTSFGQERVRFRLHSGVYSFRRGRGFGRAFVEGMEIMLDSRIAFSRKIAYPGDDIALAFEIVKRGLSHRILPMHCNYEIGPSSRIYRRDDARTASVLHYHHCLTRPNETEWLLGELDAIRPDVASWLVGRVPLDPRSGGLSGRLVRRTLAELRARRAARHEACSRATVA